MVMLAEAFTERKNPATDSEEKGKKTVKQKKRSLCRIILVVLPKTVLEVTFS